MRLIDQKKYFVLHAPRQTGKTSCLMALMDYLNEKGKHTCLYFNVEIAQAARENVKQGMKAILSELANDAWYFLDDSFLKDSYTDILEKSGEFAALETALTLWSKQNRKPVIIFIDEVDSLIGDTLISLLRQLRSGYPKRARGLFPQSIILCGVRDIRDYRIHSSAEKTIITGGSAFNIKAESLRLGDFSRKETEELYLCHTQETGQAFDPKATEAVWNLTEGQPWLVNALGYEMCFKTIEDAESTKLITAETVHQAKENIIIRRETHIDQLVDKLKEERVRRVIEPILTGLEDPKDLSPDDLGYVQDIGLIKTQGNIRIANDIYRQVIPRELIFGTQSTITHETAWYVREEDGMLDMNKLLAAFQKFFRKHSESWVERFQYKEAGPQLLLQAFLGRIINSGGRIHREYGLGRDRTDLLVIWPYQNKIQEIVIELKIRYGDTEKTVKKGLKQISDYMDKCGTEYGHLVIFDRRKNISWKEKIFCRKESYQGYMITVWGM